MNWRGWREFSSDPLRDLFAVASVHGTAGSVDLSDAWDDNTLKGQSSAPVPELPVNRALVCTGPQANLNRLKFLILNGSAKFPADWSLAAVLYARAFFSQFVSNGNATSYLACSTLAGVLCQPDGITPLANAAGELLPDISAGGTRYIGANDFELLHSWGRAATLQVANGTELFGHDNHFTRSAVVDYASSGYYSGAQIGRLNAQLLVQPSQLLVDTRENSTGAMAYGDAVPGNVESVNKALGAYFFRYVQCRPSPDRDGGRALQQRSCESRRPSGNAVQRLQSVVHFNPSMGATYTIAPATLYADYAVNNRVSTSGEIECSDPLAPSRSADPPNLRELVSYTMECGLRGAMARVRLLGAALRWNLSAFRTVLHNDIRAIATSLSFRVFCQHW